MRRPPGPPAGPLALTNPWALSGKAALACLLALQLCRVLGNPDLVSSAFVAVLCTSPTLISGLRQATAQILGSLLGGIWGALMVVADVPRELGIPLAVGLSIGTTFAIRFPVGYPVAAFTALVVQAIPRGGPVETYRVRIEAVAIAALSAFVANLLVSAFAYRSVFRRRLLRIEAEVDRYLDLATSRGPKAVLPCFPLLAAMESDLGAAFEELHWRGRSEVIAWLDGVRTRVEELRHLLHLVYDLGLLMEEQGLDPGEAAAFLAWVRTGSGTAPPLPEPLRPVAARIAVRVAARRTPLDDQSRSPESGP